MSAHATPHSRVFLAMIVMGCLPAIAKAQEPVPGEVKPQTGLAEPSVTGSRGVEKVKSIDPDAKVVKSDAEWRRLLTPTQYAVVRQKATEPPFTGKYATGHYNGIFACVGCGSALFNAKTKFNSGTGWPSFYQAASPRALEQAMDYLMPGEARVEVTCRRCDAHLGHVFNDGPPPTGLRYCINSASIKLKPASAFDKNGLPKVEEKGTATEAELDKGPSAESTAESSEPKTAPAAGRTQSLRARRGIRSGSRP